MKKIYSFILLFPLLLVSCGEGNINPSTSPSEEESYKLIVNCPGHEDESYEFLLASQVLPVFFQHSCLDSFSSQP